MRKNRQIFDERMLTATVGMPLSFPERIDKAAKEMGTSRSQLVTGLIAKFLEEYEAAEAKSA
jgi:metal-responsive CopG/Arc/MetJ family transcriptional regulator